MGQFWLQALPDALLRVQRWRSLFCAERLRFRFPPTLHPLSDKFGSVAHHRAQDLFSCQAQAINVRDRYSETASLMCAEDVLCAMDPAVTGAVSVDLREKEEGSDEMTSKGVESMCRCVMEENLDIGTLYEKIRRVCGDGASSNWMSPEKNGKGKKLLMSWASKRVDEACGRITDEKSVTPPCPWNYAAKRVGQRKMMGVLGYSNDLVCSWRLHGWKVPPNNDEGVAQTLLRHQLEPLQETVKSQLQSNN